MSDPVPDLLRFLKELDARSIAYTLACNRDEAIMVTLAVPGERWEVEFLDDGTIEIERFRSDGTIFDERALTELFDKLSD